MAATNNKNHVSLEKKTKAELIALLGKGEQQIKSLDEKLDSQQKEFETAQKSVEELTNENKKLAQEKRENERLILNFKMLESESTGIKEENVQLKKQIESLEGQKKNAEEKLTKATAERNKEKTEDKEQTQLLTKLTEENKKLKDLVAKYSAEPKKTDELALEKEHALSQKTNIRLEIIPIDKNYRIRLIDILSLEKITLAPVDRELKQLDFSKITKFLKDHLPQLEDAAKEKMMPEKVEEKVTSAKEIKKISKEKVQLQHIDIQQFGNKLKEGQAILHGSPFNVAYELHLPYAVDQTNADIDVPFYGIHVAINETKTHSVCFEEDFAWELKMGQKDYYERLKLPELDPGKYEINFSTVVPFAHIREMKEIVIQVN